LSIVGSGRKDTRPAQDRDRPRARLQQHPGTRVGGGTARVDVVDQHDRPPAYSVGSRYRERARDGLGTLATPEPAQHDGPAWTDENVAIVRHAR